MDESEYEKLSQKTHEELMGYLKPMSLYMKNYRHLLSR